MFALIESCPEQRVTGDWGSRLASVALHSFLTAAAIAATRQVVNHGIVPQLVDTTVVWQVPPPPPPDMPAASSPSTPTTAPVAPAVPPLEIPPVIPPPGVAPAPIPAGSPVPVSAPGLPGLPTGDPVPAGSAPLEARDVDVPPVMESHPAVRYPDVLRQAGIEGRVVVEAVLDSLGRAEPSSLRILESPHPLFDAEAAWVVRMSRYRPARAGGHAVRVRVRVPVTFSLRR